MPKQSRATEAKATQCRRLGNMLHWLERLACHPLRWLSGAVPPGRQSCNGCAALFMPPCLLYSRTPFSPTFVS